MAREKIFRKEAIEHHFRDPESSGVIASRIRWTPLVLAVTLTMAIATTAYVWLAHDVVHALFARLLR